MPTNEINANSATFMENKVLIKLVLSYFKMFLLQK